MSLFKGYMKATRDTGNEQGNSVSHEPTLEDDSPAQARLTAPLASCYNPAQRHHCAATGLLAGFRQVAQEPQGRGTT